MNASAFIYYVGHFPDENALTKEAKSFRKVKTGLLENFSTKKTESETMKEAVNLTYQDEYVKEVLCQS